MATFAPAGATFSAAPRGMPSLAAATMTFRFFNPRSNAAPFPLRLRFLPQVSIIFIDPILTGRIKDVQVDRVLQRNRLMRHVGWNAQHFPSRDREFPVVDVEVQGAFENIGDLLIVMAVQRHPGALLQQDARGHYVGAHNHLPSYLRAQVFYLDVIPSHVLCSCNSLWHVISPAKVTTFSLGLWFSCGA